MSNVDKPKTSRPFGEVLAELRQGAALNEASDQLQNLIAVVQSTGKKGSITVTLTVAPAANMSSALAVFDDIDVKLPKPEKGGSIMFSDKQFNLTRKDPTQMAMELRVAGGTEAEQGELKVAGGDS